MIVTLRDDEIDLLRAAVEASPHDTFHRCNLACSLAAAGAIDEALLQLAAATATVSTPISGGCVAAAIRDVADHFAQQWSLPLSPPAVHGGPPSPRRTRLTATA